MVRALGRALTGQAALPLAELDEAAQASVRGAAYDAAEVELFYGR
jgi:hypothetical protein